MREDLVGSFRKTGRRRALAALFVMASWLLAADLLAQRPNYLLFTDPQRRFSVEFPREWTWLMVSGSGEPLVTFIHPRKEAAVVVERFRMRQKLNRDEVTDLFAQIESEVLKENQPLAADVVSKIVVENGKKLILIDYVRPGIDTRERVRQYSVPVGGDLYRITCMTIGGQFAKYEPTFGAVVQSLKTAGELPPAPAK
jgi:hypothetical protein